MKRFLASLVLFAIPSCAAVAAEDASELLCSQTQEMVDAVAPGNAAPWQKYVDDHAVFTDENGTLMTKAQLLGGFGPLPPGASGTIQVTDWKATVLGEVAVATYIEDEHENFHGQQLHALYRTTDTWLEAADGWRLIAEQDIALQQDPPAVVLPTATLDQYAGTYRAGLDYTYTIARNGDELTGQTNNGKPAALKAELVDVLFTPDQPRTRKIFQRDAAGKVTGFVSRREERDVVFTRIN